jgi:hypothetical protein
MYFDVVAFVDGGEEAQEGEAEHSRRSSDAASANGTGATSSATVSTITALRLGVVTEEPSAANPTATLTVTPLRKSSDWADSGLWVEDEREAEPRRIALSRVRAVLSGAALSQRQDTEGNPHGEHAHDVWELPLSGIELDLEWLEKEEEVDGAGRAVRRRAVEALLVLSPSPSSSS